MKRNRLLHTAALALSCAALLTGALSCGSGLFDTEDDAAPAPEFTVTTTGDLSNVGFGDVKKIDVTLKLTEKRFSSSIISAAKNNEDIAPYFDIALLDASGSEVTDTLLETAALLTASNVEVKLDTGGTNPTLDEVATTITAQLALTVAERADDTAAATGSLVVRYAGLSASVCNYTFSKVEYSWGTQAPAAVDILKAAQAKNTAGDGTTTAVTVITLGGRVAKDIAEGEEVGTVTIDGKDIPAKALSAVTAKETILPVLLQGSESFSGAPTAVSLRAGYLESGAVDHQSLTATAGALVYPRYLQDFAGLYTDDASSNPSGNLKDFIVATDECYPYSAVKTDDAHGTYAYIGAKGSGNRYATLIEPLTVLTDESGAQLDYVVEFDAGIKLGKEKGKAASSIGVVNTLLKKNESFATGSNETLTGFQSYLVYGFSTTTLTDGASTKYFYGGYDASKNSADYANAPTIEIPDSATQWCHYRFEISPAAKTCKATVTKTDGSVLLETSDTITLTPSTLYLSICNGRNGGGTSLDNVLLYSLK